MGRTRPELLTVFVHRSSQIVHNDICCHYNCRQRQCREQSPSMWAEENPTRKRTCGESAPGYSGRLKDRTNQRFDPFGQPDRARQRKWAHEQGLITMRYSGKPSLRSAQLRSLRRSSHDHEPEIMRGQQIKAAAAQQASTRPSAPLDLHCPIGEHTVNLRQCPFDTTCDPRPRKHQPLAVQQLDSPLHCDGDDHGRGWRSLAFKLRVPEQHSEQRKAHRDPKRRLCRLIWPPRSVACARRWQDATRTG